MFHFRFIPESPRWLLVKNKKEEARNKLQKVAAFNKKEMPNEELELKDAKEGQRTGDFRDLFSSFNMTKRTLISCFSWLVNIYFLYLPYPLVLTWHVTFYPRKTDFLKWFLHGKLLSTNDLTSLKRIKCSVLRPSGRSDFEQIPDESDFFFP